MSLRAGLRPPISALVLAASLAPWPAWSFGPGAAGTPLCERATRLALDPAPTPMSLADRVRWLGRVDTSDPDAPKFSWSYSGFVARFSGTSLYARMANEDRYFFQTIIDGRPAARFEVAAGIGVYPLAADLSPGEHSIELRRETEGKYGASTLLALHGTLLPPPAGSGRLIEVIGDSISAGYGNLGLEHHTPEQHDGCSFSYATESAYIAYAAQAARAFDADLSLIALSGWGVFRDKDHATLGAMPKVYSQSIADTEAAPWDFRNRAQAVVINLGTNDFAGPASFDPGAENYTRAYHRLIAQVRRHHPGAWIFCIVGPVLTDHYPPGANRRSTARRYLTQVIAQAQAAGDRRVRLLEFPAQDIRTTGCDWHPSRMEHDRMARTLIQTIKDTLGW